MMDGPPPAQHAGVRHHQDGYRPSERGVRVAVQVEHVRAVAIGQLEEPLARAAHVLPRLIHPLEPELALDDADRGAELAAAAGLSRTAFAKVARVSFAKVAEYQARGVIHFHAVIRIDGPDGPDTPPPGWADAS